MSNRCYTCYTSLNPMCNIKNAMYIACVTLLHIESLNLKKSLYMCNSVLRGVRV